jgi:hypothetical protein
VNDNGIANRRPETRQPEAAFLEESKMEALTRMVVDSLARHGLDRPVDPRRLQWSRWFRCDSTHSLLTVPSKPGIFALAEEVMNLGPTKTHGGTDAFVRPAEQSPAAVSIATTADAGTVQEGQVQEGQVQQGQVQQGQVQQGNDRQGHDREGHDFSRAEKAANSGAASAAEVSERRMLAVLQFAEDDDMAFTLDRMFTRINPMRDRLASGLCFLRFVVIADQAQRRSICAALNQWMLSSAEKASGLPSDFSSSLEFVARAPSPATASANSLTVPSTGTRANVISIARNLDSGAAKNLHCPHPLPSGF